jgi:hypothetical protein
MKAPACGDRSFKDGRRLGVSDCGSPKIITGKLAPARYVPSAATFIGTQDHIGHRCIAGSGFDI